MTSDSKQMLTSLAQSHYGVVTKKLQLTSSDDTRMTMPHNFPQLSANIERWQLFFHGYREIETNGVFFGDFTHTLAFTHTKTSAAEMTDLQRNLTSAKQISQDNCHSRGHKEYISHQNPSQHTKHTTHGSCHNR